MPKKKPKRREVPRIRKRLKTRAIVSRLIYDPTTKSNKFTKEKRKLVQKNLHPRHSNNVPPLGPTQILKFGSINLNGLDPGTFWAVQELLEANELDVRFEIVKGHNDYTITLGSSTE